MNLQRGLELFKRKEYVLFLFWVVGMFKRLKQGKDRPPAWGQCWGQMPRPRRKGSGSGPGDPSEKCLSVGQKTSQSKLWQRDVGPKTTLALLTMARD